MKKLVSILATIAISASSTSYVLACPSSKANEVKDVVFMFDAAAGTNANIQKQYKKIVDDFNAANADSSIKVTLETPTAGAISGALASGESLPDLYVTYPDNVVKYLASAPDEALDMSTVMPSTLKPKLQSFMNEGKLTVDGKEKQLVLPMAKSFDFSAVNLRLLKELTTMAITKISSVSKLGDYLGNSNIVVSDLYKNELPENFKLVGDEEKIFTSLANAKNQDDVKKVLLLNSNLATISGFMYRLDREYKLVNADKMGTGSKIYGLGIDSLSNKVFSEYAELLKTDSIKTLSENKDFLYNYYDNKFSVNKSTGLGGLQNEMKFLQQLKDLQGKDSASLRGDTTLDSKDTEMLYVPTLTGKKKYSSDFFAAGTMLLASGSTAGSFYYKSGNKVNKDLKVTFDDVLVMGTPTDKGEAYTAQQGPGIAGFKSSSEDKQKVANKFLEYLLSPEKQAYFGIFTGYLPSNEENYASDSDYVKWIKGETKPKDENGKEQSRSNPLLKQYIDMVNSGDANHFFTVEGSPLGNGVRSDVLTSVIQNKMMDDKAKDVFLKDSNLTDYFWGNDSTELKTRATYAFNSILTDYDPNGSVTYKAQLPSVLKEVNLLDRKED
ncbi:hypothetical protein SHELI_v1c09070 [Spiroplasma helicoides]|uniref:Sn-glycerol-3-phosphate ABC transporter substrate-binding protein n=1 Tax=Spiroplasma helicoides TaxID=216938 RepID=A0A1B3SLP0_9MOLU|nr:extracellular solute-binding protein [Spiroplasma helicoides]AOG60856.1 hypothetical protein SHELI_v1c09070 [Spiroplasma helicoides]